MDEEGEMGREGRREKGLDGGWILSLSFAYWVEEEEAEEEEEEEEEEEGRETDCQVVVVLQ